MLLPCPKIAVSFPQEGICLGHDDGRLCLDEHGGFVLKATGLKLLESPEPGSEPGIYLEAAVPDPKALREEIRTFAAHHRLVLSPPGDLPAQLEEQPILTACRIPEKQSFVYCEAAHLSARATSRHTLEIRVTGPFRSRRAPCQEGDLVIQLSPDAMARLLSILFGLVQKG